jgi:membrane protease YdiL (CAAX protease family)
MSGKLLQVIATGTIIWASLKDNALESVSLVLVLTFSALALLIRAADRLEFMDDSKKDLSNLSCAATAYLGGTAVNSLAFALPVIPALVLAQSTTVEFILFLTLGMIIAVHLTVLAVVLMETESIKIKEILKTVMEIAETGVGTSSKLEKLMKNGGALSCGIALASIVQPIFSNYAKAQKTSLSQQLVSPATSVILVVCLCLIMPLCEEILFRYLIYGKLAKTEAARYGVWPLMIGTSVLFALFHPLVAAGPIFLAGMVFNILYVTSGELSTAIIAHCGYNLFAIMQTL